MNYTHMHGCSNSFYVVDAREHAYTDDEVFAKALKNCEGRLDVDGVITIRPSTTAHVKTVILNADGSRAPMCGNGVRCLAKYVVEDSPECAGSVLNTVTFGEFARRVSALAHKIPSAVARVLLKSILQDYGSLSDRICVHRLMVQTDSGDRTHFCLSRNGVVELVTVEMGRAEMRLAELNCTLEGETASERPIKVGERSYRATVVGLGNLHCVIFVDDVQAVDLESEGRAIESCTRIFPDSVNVHFAKVLGTNHIRIRTWERGSGATLACGTGCCATVAAGMQAGYCAASCRVDQSGGTLHIEVGSADEDGQILMSGPAVEVGRGCWI